MLKFLRPVQSLLSRLNRTAPADDRYAEKIRAGLYRLGEHVRFLPYQSDANLTAETPAMRLAYREMWREPSVKSAILGKVLSVAALDLQVQAASSAESDRRVADFVRYALTQTKGSVRHIAWGILSGGLMDGFSVCEKVLRQPTGRGHWGDKIGLAVLKAKDSAYLELHGDEFRNVTTIRDSRTREEWEAKDFVVWSHLPLFESPTGMSDFRAAYASYWKMDTAQTLRMIALDRYTLPMLKGVYQTTEQRPGLEEALQSARSQSWVSLPAGAQIEAMSLAVASQSDFQTAIDDLRKDIFLGITGAFLQALEGSVANAAGSSAVHKDTTQLLQWYLSAEVSDAITSQVVPDLVDLNFAGAEYPTVTLSSIDDAAMASSLAIDQGLQGLGLSLSKAELYRKYSRQAPLGPEDELRSAGVAGPVSPATPGFGAPQPLMPWRLGEPNPTDPPAAQLAEDPDGPADHTVAPADDRAEAESLLDNAMKSGSKSLAKIAKPALKRWLERGRTGQSLFTHEEKSKLSDSLAETLATADLLGRSRIRLRIDQAKAAADHSSFSETATSFQIFADEGLKPMPPERALEYFKNLVPALYADPKRYGQEMRRKAFTLAQATEAELLNRVQDVVAERLKTGEGIRTAANEIDRLLSDAGVASSNPQYSEMVFRTNAMDAYNTGATQELQDPDVIEAFPVWRYSGIRDGRQRKEHEVHFGQYFSSSTAFTEVRDSVKVSPFNCRCTMIPIYKSEWKRLQASGATVSTVG